MYDVELKIKRDDWVFIVFVGLLFGSLISAIGYFLLEKSALYGAMFGAILGLFISLFSIFFITISNSYILPMLPRAYWHTGSMFFSFLSGFLGSVCAVWFSSYARIGLLPAFEQKMLWLSFAIGLLTYLVGVLLHRFVKMRNENEKTKELLLQSRVSSLETQLNPHFLFNSINSVAELIYKDPSKAEEALISISDFLRSVMKENSLISIEEEIANIQKYIAIENIRFDDKIKLNIMADESIKNYLIPKFSIGLIVENAIKHGFDRSRTLNISINVAKRNGGVEIGVENDGKALKSKQFGIGLKNLSERLKYLCNGSLEIGREDKKEFIIKLRSGGEDTHSRR